MRTTPRLSICIPTFNRADILSKTLHHLEKFCDDSVEIAVADNASTDKTPQVIEEFRVRFKYFRTLRHSENLGAFRNTSAALSLATGKYLFTLCDDDEVIFDGLVAAMRLLEEEPTYSGVFGGYLEWNRESDSILATIQHVTERENFSRGDKIAIFNRFSLLWLPLCRTDIYQRYFSYDEDSFGMWPLVGALIEHGNVAVIPDLLYKHAHTEPRMEYNLTENWYHDRHRSQYECYVGRIGAVNPDELAQVVNRRVGPAYLQGVRFALMKGQYLKARHYMLRARAYGFTDESIVRTWERESLVPMIAEKLKDATELVPGLCEVVFEVDPRVQRVMQRFKEIATGQKLRVVEANSWQNTDLGDNQFLVTYEYQADPRSVEGMPAVRIDPSRYRAVKDLIETCRITGQELTL